MRRVVEEGDIVSCPECSLDIAKFNIDKYVGEIIHASDLSPIPDDLTLENGSACVCPRCNSTWFSSHGKIHLKNIGWS